MASHPLAWTPNLPGKGPTARTDPAAKLNLFLDLLGRRPDGYNAIDTVMVAVDWCDTLQLRRTASDDLALQMRWQPDRDELSQQLGLDTESVDQVLPLPGGDDNLIVRALGAFRARFGIDGGFHCRLDKRIPCGAGMGGASSDAAAVLRAAATLCDIPPSDLGIVEIAARIGSDVPFFLGTSRARPSSAAARATGRGEIIEPIELPATLHFVVAYPAIALSTAAVYQAYQDAEPAIDEAAVAERQISAEQFIRQLRQDPFPFNGEHMTRNGLLINRLAKPAFSLAPAIESVLELMRQAGGEVCQLTGSGSACFALVSDASAAKRVAGRLRGCENQFKERFGRGLQVEPVRSVSLPRPIQIG